MEIESSIQTMLGIPPDLLDKVSRQKKQDLSILTFSLHSFIDVPRGLAFENGISPYNSDILCLTKIWLTEEVWNESVFHKFYVIHRSDRTSESGLSKYGGVLVAVRATFHLNKCSLRTRMKIA